MAVKKKTAKPAKKKVAAKSVPKKVAKSTKAKKPLTPYETRLALYEKLEKDRDSKVIVYVTGDRRGQETQIAQEALDLFVHHLDRIGVVPKISLFLYTCGGNTAAAWSLINLLRIFADNLEIIVPRKAQSAGTLLCLGADSIVMTKQAVLGPIDPSVQTPLNPQVPGAQPHNKVPVSVESINGFIEFANQTLGQKTDLSQVFLHLASNVNPLVLGDAYRARGQIRMLASRLLAGREKSEKDIDNILSFLCSESGSHDYTINRREAMTNLGLPIDKPNDAQYKIIKEIHDSIAEEMDLLSPYDPKALLGTENQTDYSLCRALIESVTGGSHAFLSEGQLTRHRIPVPPQPNMPPLPPQEAIHDDRKFEGWRLRHER